ncbi:MAG: hypothetical protein PHD76_02210 [Methylacidiphilales bacterium]|nr:hypothetical protein [Candidatus Methylacidiphilales bacterium]
MRKTFSTLSGFIALALFPAIILAADTVQLADGKDKASFDGEFSGYVQENITIPVNDFRTAVVKIDNKAVAIDGYWEFKDEAGQVLKTPVILSQPADITAQMVVALRSPGEAIVTVTEDGKTKHYKINSNARFKANSIEKEVEEAIRIFVNDPGLKVRVLPPQASLVGANLSRAFGDDTASDIVAPRGQTAGNAASSLLGADDFRPTIILEGEVENDIVVTKAVNIAHAYTKNLVNLLSVRNPLQVKIAVKVVEVTHNMDSHIGLQHRSAASKVDAAASGGGSTAGFALGFSSAAPFFETGGNGNIPIFGANLPTNINTTVNLSELNATATLLQEPTLTVLNGQPAMFLVGQTVSVPTSVSFDANHNPIQSFAQQNIGIELLVNPLVKEEETYRPDAAGLIPWGNITQQENKQPRSNPGPSFNQVTNTISENGIVQLGVQPSISSLGPDVNGVSSFNRNAVETRVAIKHGESLVIGGLFDDQTRKNLESIPFISKIPILGELFKDRSKDKKRNELIFVLTPTILGLKDLDNAKDYNPRSQTMRDILTDEGVLPMVAKPTRISAAEVLPRTLETAVIHVPSEVKPDATASSQNSKSNANSNTQQTKLNTAPEPESAPSVAPAPAAPPEGAQPVTPDQAQPVPAAPADAAQPANPPADAVPSDNGPKPEPKSPEGALTPRPEQP